MRALITYFVRYPIWSNAVIVVLIAAGFLSFFGIKKSFFPETPSRLVTISVVYPGASPEEMEEGVVLKVEEALKGIVGIDQITSESRENTATIRVEGQQGYDPEIVRWVVRQVDLNEYKRQQAAPGLRVTSKAFGPGRRYPIVQRYGAGTPGDPDAPKAPGR